MPLLRDLWEGVLSLLFPPYCLVCEQRLETVKLRVCPQCWRALMPVTPEVQRQKVIPPELETIYPAYIFDDRIQIIIHALKYRGYRSLGLELGRLVGQSLPARIDQNSNALLVPIPLHPVKLRERGYNQAALIARGISAVTGYPVIEKVVRRVKNTRTQTQLSAAERQENMAGAFAPGDTQKLIPGALVILVDDVFTTGATLSAAAEVLKRAGVARIIGVTVVTPL